VHIGFEIADFVMKRAVRRTDDDKLDA